MQYQIPTSQNEVGENYPHSGRVWTEKVLVSFIDSAKCPQCGHDVHLKEMWYDELRRVACTICGMSFDTEFFKPVPLRQANVWDGRGGKKLVRPGDAVEMLPINPVENKNRNGLYLSRSSAEFMLRWLGNGPYIISWIGLYPCGRTMLYVKTATSSGSGVYAYDFKAVEQREEPESKRDILKKERKVMIRGEAVVPEKKCPPGFDYCWECGHIALAEEFTKNDRCPNPDCPHPWNWDD